MSVWVGLGTLLACMLLSLMARAETLQLARLDGTQASLLELDTSGLIKRQPLPGTLTTPLGSLWKLYVHAYALDARLADPPYQCTGQHQDEVYCCERGERIDRDQALVRSCGLYYAPARLGITDQAWRSYWQARQAPSWLRELGQLQPGTEVPVQELLSTLATLPAQKALREVLLDVLVHARDPVVIGHLGSQLRVKTWSWHRGKTRIGGFAGWLSDGTPVWASASGTSQSMLSSHAAALGRTLAAGNSDLGECVVVALFERYPLAAVERLDGTGAVSPGRLQGSFRVRFTNGNALDIASQGELILSRLQGTLKLSAYLSREEYVARVLDREAAPEPAAAARALAVSIRSYLKQQAGRSGECLAIADSSAQQRVAPRPATAQARAIAAWTAELILAGSDVMYHQTLAEENRLSWQQAVSQARSGARYEQILKAAFPRASLSRWGRPNSACQALPEAASWLRARLPQWRPLLDLEPGYYESREFDVCKLPIGRPYVDRERRRIYVRGLQSLQDRLDLTHEYLHLAFAAHPRGQDEDFVETLARRLVQ